MNAPELCLAIVEWFSFVAIEVYRFQFATPFDVPTPLDIHAVWHPDRDTMVREVPRPLVNGVEGVPAGFGRDRDIQMVRESLWDAFEQILGPLVCIVRDRRLPCAFEDSTRVRVLEQCAVVLLRVHPSEKRRVLIADIHRAREGPEGCLAGLVTLRIREHRLKGRMLLGIDIVESRMRLDNVTQAHELDLALRLKEPDELSDSRGVDVCVFLGNAHEASVCVALGKNRPPNSRGVSRPDYVVQSEHLCQECEFPEIRPPPPGLQWVRDLEWERDHREPDGFASLDPVADLTCVLRHGWPVEFMRSGLTKSP